MNQQTLFPQPLTIDEVAARFHAENPHIMDAVVRMARERIANGHSQWSVRAAFYELRYMHDVRTTGESVPEAGHVKLANAHTAWYARRILAEYPEFRNFFILGPRH